MFDFLRIATAVPQACVADPEKNAENIIKMLEKAEEYCADIIIFPELSVTGASCGDLFFQKNLLRRAIKCVGEIADKTTSVAVVGAPLNLDGCLYNCAFVVYSGKIIGIVPKTFIAASGDAFEARWFTSSVNLSVNNVTSAELGLNDNYDIPVGNKLVFDISGIKFAVEIGEDGTAPIPTGSILSLCGAEVILHLRAETESVGRRELTLASAKAFSAANLCGYASVCAGYGESVTDGVYHGNAVVTELGKLIGKSDILREEGLLYNDIDTGKIKTDRLRSSSFKGCAAAYCEEYRLVEIKGIKLKGDGSFYPVRKEPFLPFSDVDVKNRCLEIFEMQAVALKRRMETTGSKLVIGVSGGLDSTLALLVCVKAAKLAGRPVTDVYGVTLPCFGTSGRTYNNALKLMEKLGISMKEINIKQACENHFADIGHDGSPDLTFENAQARERTQVLMDYAGMVGGFVVGTGDLSELALGWCTYNADHMSMYGVNCGVPKSLISHMLKVLAKQEEFSDCQEILLDVADTPISPELLPPKADGDIAQVTEDIVGPYILHDFFIYYILRYGFEPDKVFHLAKLAFRQDYNKETILKWLKNFYRRFFSQQFKRSCQPDGVKIGSVGISPRTSLKMPSDAIAALWLKQIDELK